MPRRKGDAWFWGCQNYPTCTAPTTTTPPVPTGPSRRLLLKQLTQAVNDRMPAKGCRHLLVKPWANGTVKAKDVSAVRGHHQRQGGDHWNQQVGPEDTGDRRREASFQPDPDGGGTYRAGSGAGNEVDEAKRLLEEAQVEVQAAQEQSDRSSIFGWGQAMEEMAQIKKLLEAN